MLEENKIKGSEIDLIDLGKKIWKARNLIYKSIGFCFVLGVILVMGTPKEYKSEVILLTESGSKNNMSGLIQQFTGFGLGGSANEGSLSPLLYPDIIKSTPFLLEIMNQKVIESRFDSSMTVSHYVKNYTHSSILSLVFGYTIGLPSKINSLLKKQTKLDFKDSGRTVFFKLTDEQSNIVDYISEHIKVKKGESEGILIVSAEMQDPLVSTQLVDSVVKSLTKYVIDYKTQKARAELKFISDRFLEVKASYFDAQHNLAYFRDKNKNIILANVKNEEERLLSEYNIAFNLYNTLAQQLEQSKIKVQEKTPVFKIIDPAKVPLSKSSPKSGLIIIFMLFLGFSVGIFIIIGSQILKRSR